MGKEKHKETDVEIIEHKTVYRGYFTMEKYKLRYRLFNGEWSREFAREVFIRGSAAGILLYDPKQQKVIIIEQFRVGAIKSSKSPWLYEIVAGILEPDETIEELIIREAKEEAGLAVEAIQPICEYWVSPGGCTEYVYLFCGKVDSSKAGGIHGLSSEGEDIRVHVIDVQEAFQMVKSGAIDTAPAIIALQWLELNQDKVFQE